MTRSSIPHPCLACRLPECDDARLGCALRRAIADYNWLKKRRLAVPDDIRQRYGIAFRELRGPAHKEQQNARNRARRQQQRDTKATQRKLETAHA